MGARSRSCAAFLAGCLVLLPLGSPASAAGSDSPAAARARAAADTVNRLAAEYRHRSAAAAAAAAELAAAYTAWDRADNGARIAGEQLARARARRAARVRALYARGLPAAGGLALLSATTPDDALWQMAVGTRINRQLARDEARDERAASIVFAAGSQHAAEADATAQRLSRALTAVRDEQDAARAALAQATAELARLDSAARQEAEARAAAAALAAAQADADATRWQGQEPITALAIPAAYERLYRTAAATCPGLEWTLLAAIGQVESGHGRNPGPSSAGALGPMQFMPATFAAYGVDGDRDGHTDPWNAADAIFSAAAYVCSGGGGKGPQGVHTALLRYNHAEWYVDLVLGAQAAIRARNRL